MAHRQGFTDLDHPGTPAAPRQRDRRPGKAIVAGLCMAVLATTAASAANLTAVSVKADSSRNEHTPAADGAWLMWTQNSKAAPQQYNVFAQRGSRTPIRINARGTQGHSGGIDGRTAVYAQWSRRTGDDLFTIDLVSKRRTKLPRKVNGPYHEFHPTISGRWVLFTRYDWDRDTMQVLLYDRRSRQLRVLATERGRRGVWAGQVNGRYAVWERWSGRNTDVFRYDIRYRSSVRVPRPVFAHQYGPSVATDGTVYYTRSGSGCGNAAEVARFPSGGPAERVYAYPREIGGGYSYVDDKPTGGRDIFFARFDCRRDERRAWDVYKVVDAYAVTVARTGEGSGTVTSSPAGITCGTDCTETFARGATVTLTATPDEGSQVAGWSRPECGTLSTCTVKVTRNETVSVKLDVVPPPDDPPTESPDGG